VCISAVIELLAVLQHYKPKTKNGRKEKMNSKNNVAKDDTEHEGGGANHKQSALAIADSLHYSYQRPFGSGS